MEDLRNLGNERNQQLKIQCIDFATRIVGKPIYITDKEGNVTKHQDCFLAAAESIYNFVTGIKQN